MLEEHKERTAETEILITGLPALHVLTLWRRASIRRIGHFWLREIYRDPQTTPLLAHSSARKTALRLRD